MVQNLPQQTSLQTAKLLCKLQKLLCKLRKPRCLYFCARTENQVELKSTKIGGSLRYRIRDQLAPDGHMGTRNISVTDRGLARTPLNICSLFSDKCSVRRNCSNTTSVRVTRGQYLSHHCRYLCWAWKPDYTGLISIEESIEESRDISNCSLVIENWHQTRTLLAWLFLVEFDRVLPSFHRSQDTTNQWPSFCNGSLQRYLLQRSTRVHKDLHPIESNDHR